MHELETAVDQMLSISGGYGGPRQRSEVEGNDFDLPDDFESPGEYEGGDFDETDLALENNELVERNFEADLETGFSDENELEWHDESDNEFEFQDENELEWHDESDNEFEFQSEYTGGLLSEAEVEEMARDLVGISNPQEMEAFIGKLFKRKVFKRLAKAGSKVVSGKLKENLARASSSLIGRALPIVGSTLGTALLPGIGTGVGGALGGQLRSLFSPRSRRSMGRSLTRTAVRSARRVGQRNPLTSLLNRGNRSALRSLFGFEMETDYGDPQIEVAKRVVRTVADAADIADRNNNESDASIADAFRQSVDTHLPVAVRAAMLTGPTPR